MTVPEPNPNFLYLFSFINIGKLFIVDKNQKKRNAKHHTTGFKKITIFEIVSETVSHFNVFRRNKLPMDFKNLVLKFHSRATTKQPIFH